MTSILFLPRPQIYLIRPYVCSMFFRQQFTKKTQGKKSKSLKTQTYTQKDKTIKFGWFCQEKSCWQIHIGFDKNTERWMYLLHYWYCVKDLPLGHGWCPMEPYQGRRSSTPYSWYQINLCECALFLTSKNWVNMSETNHNRTKRLDNVKIINIHYPF